MLPPITLIDRIEHGYLWLHRQADCQAISEQNGESSKDFGESGSDKMKHHRKKREEKKHWAPMRVYMLERAS